MATYLRILHYARRYPGLCLSQVICASLMALCIIIFPYITGFITKNIIPHPERHREFFFWVAVAFFGYLLRLCFNFIRIQANSRLEQNVTYDIRSDLYRKIQNLPVSWFDSSRTGDIMIRVTEDVGEMKKIVIECVELGLISFLQIAAVLSLMFYLNPAVAMGAALPMPVLIWGALLYSKKGRGRHTARRKASSDLSCFLHDSISGIRQIKLFTRESERLARFNILSGKIRDASLAISRGWALHNPLMTLFERIGYTLVLGIGGWSVLQQTMPLGDLITFLLLINLLYVPTAKLRRLNSHVLSSRAAAARVFGILDLEEEPTQSDGRTLPDTVEGQISFEHLNFSYKQDSLPGLSSLSPNQPLVNAPPALRDISLRIEPGQTIALVGATGAGKSTLVNLLCGFYDYAACGSGSIRIDDLELCEISKASLRENIGYVTQEAFLFSGSVRDNLLMAKAEATEHELWDALKTARAEAFIRKLPDGLDTEVGERGSRFSGGEKQRISIARALLKDPPILLLDEATASVDAATESLIQQAFDQLMQNRTCVVIAHRLSTIRNADVIHVLENGAIIESGSHLELLAKNGSYTRLCRQSFIHAEVEHDVSASLSTARSH